MKSLEYEWGVCEYAIFKNGVLYTCSLTEEDAEEYMDRYENDEPYSHFECRLITEEERVGNMRSEINRKWGSYDK